MMVPGRIQFTGRVSGAVSPFGSGARISVAGGTTVGGAPQLPSPQDVYDGTTPPVSSSDPSPSATPPTPATSAGEPGTLRTALQQHVDFFDSNQDGQITFSDTYTGLARLGVDRASAGPMAFMINKALASKTEGSGYLTINSENIANGIHQSDSGVFDAQGNYNAAAFEALFTQYDTDKDGALSRGELMNFFTHNSQARRDSVGSRVEFGLLLELAGEDNAAGEKVLTRDRLTKFYDGSLFPSIAQEVESGEREGFSGFFGGLRALGWAIRG